MFGGTSKSAGGGKFSFPQSHLASAEAATHPHAASRNTRARTGARLSTSRANRGVRVKEPPAPSAPRLAPTLSLKVVPSGGRTSAPHAPQGELRKEGSGKGAEPGAQARGAERGRRAPSTPRSPERPEPAGRAEFRYHFSSPEQSHPQGSLRFGDAAWCALLPGQRVPARCSRGAPGPGPRSEHRHALRCPRRRRRCARLRPQRERGERAASEARRLLPAPPPLGDVRLSCWCWERTLRSLDPRIKLAVTLFSSLLTRCQKGIGAA